jgi:hypothetical protein
MKMDRDVAQDIITLAGSATESLNRLLIVAKEKCAEDEFEAFRNAVADVLVAIQADVLKPVHAQYPDLDRFGYHRRRDA